MKLESLREKLARIEREIEAELRHAEARIHARWEDVPRGWFLEPVYAWFGADWRSQTGGA